MMKSLDIINLRRGLGRHQATGFVFGGNLGKVEEFSHDVTCGLTELREFLSHHEAPIGEHS
jgi:hypothetical protein